MFRVELLADKGSVPQPGWSYVADRAFNSAQAAIAPTLSRKRGIRDAGKGGDTSSRRTNAIIRHLAELDRENHRDVAVPIPVKQAKEAGARGTRAKTTSNVRRILQSQKTFRNHLDDEEAALSNAAASGATGTTVQSGAGMSAAATAAVARVSKAAASTASRRSSTPVAPLSSAKNKKRGAGASASTPTPSVPGTPGVAASTTEAEAGEEDFERKQKLSKTEHDDDPLLRSYAPTMPSDKIVQRLLAEPPLSYNASRAGPPNSSRLPRHFCCMCGYWGKIRCKNCHLRTCGLDCYRVHEDSRCGAFF
ncbi:Zinc finger HIT-type [Penicillium angulare]|uniref:Zinc finger HIT-type n=1 Tax=Penicillium angulare TaxID=116970 RepID=UPI00254199DC|nr:Zinc finger HIT-type [Penicillium angulare]KAJ5287399.1 Zinc finger HIT-type [Penicillium angulare]